MDVEKTCIRLVGYGLFFFFIIVIIIGIIIIS